MADAFTGFTAGGRGAAGISGTGSAYAAVVLPEMAGHGEKPDFVIMVNALQRYKDLAARPVKQGYHEDDVIEAEVREVTGNKPRLPE